jgi:hypothetical protein
MPGSMTPPSTHLPLGLQLCPEPQLPSPGVQSAVQVLLGPQYCPLLQLTSEEQAAPHFKDDAHGLTWLSLPLLVQPNAITLLKSASAAPNRALWEEHNGRLVIADSLVIAANGPARK